MISNSPLQRFYKSRKSAGIFQNHTCCCNRQNQYPRSSHLQIHFWLCSLIFQSLTWRHRSRPIRFQQTHMEFLRIIPNIFQTSRVDSLANAAIFDWTGSSCRCFNAIPIWIRKCESVPISTNPNHSLSFETP